MDWEALRLVHFISVLCSLLSLGGQVLHYSPGSANNSSLDVNTFLANIDSPCSVLSQSTTSQLSQRTKPSK